MLQMVNSIERLPPRQICLVIVGNGYARPRRALLTRLIDSLYQMENTGASDVRWKGGEDAMLI